MWLQGVFRTALCSRIRSWVHRKTIDRRRLAPDSLIYPVAGVQEANLDVHDIPLASGNVSGKVSSEVTKVPLAELRRLFVMESKLSEYMERKERKKMVRCRER